jgi:hypothetical protein
MAEKSRPKFKAAEGFAVVSDWSEHPDVKKAIASGNISAIEAATKKARDEGRNAFKPKDRAVPIAELKEAYEASRAQEAARLAKIETIRNRKPRRAVGGDTAPPMPEPKPPFPVPEIPNFPSKMMFGDGDLYDAIRRPYTYENKKYEIPYFKNRETAIGPYAQNPAPSFPEFKGFGDEEYARGVAQGGLRNYNPDYGLPYPFNQRVINDDANSYFMDLKFLGGRGLQYKLPFYLAGTKKSYPYKY